MMTIRSIVYDSPAWQEAIALRIAVFCDEQGVPLAIEQDARDASAHHFGVYAAGRLIGTARYFLKDRTIAKIGRVAVQADQRGCGIGRMLMNAIHDDLAKQGIRHCELHAQTSVIGFYQKLDYVIQGIPFSEAGIEHVKMVREKSAATSPHGQSAK